MTVSKFFLYSILAVITTTVIKFVFITTLNIESLYIVYVMWFFVAVFSVACTRRLGVINYAESAVVIIVWLATAMFVDLIFLTPFTGIEVYYHVYLWITYVIMAAAVFLAHKKRHVEVRKGKFKK